MTSNVPQLFRTAAMRHSDHTALHYRDAQRWHSLTWAESEAEVAYLARGLAQLGVGPGVPVAIVSETRREWSAVDVATLFNRGIVVGVYPSLLAEQVHYQLAHSQAAVVVVEDADQARKIEAIRDRLPDVKHVLCIEPVEGLRSLNDLRAEGAAPIAWFRALADAVQPDDVATIVYTSGTTGKPKGAVLTHANLVFVVQASLSASSTRPGDRGLVFLPLAHILQRYAGYVGMTLGTEGYYVPSIPELPAMLQMARPHVLASVPRMLEKIRAKAMATAKERGPVAYSVFDWAFRTGMERAERLERGEAVPLLLRLRYRLAFRLVLGKVRDKLGGELRVLACGGAALHRDVALWFGALDILVLEGWGLTETAAPVTLNTEQAYRFGTVGKPIEGVEVRVADDGELLARGPGLFRGYFKDPEATAAVMTEDGWFHTGDIGEIDADGFVRITDRKKELIITAGGKNIAPAPIENAIARCPYVGQAVAIGNARPYLVALLAPDADAIHELALQQGWPDEPLAQRLQRPELQQAFAGAVAEANQDLAGFEQIKRWRALPSEFSVDGGELTPTLKLKRRVVEEKWGEVVEGIYRE